MPPEFVTILGVRFFEGTVEEAVERMERGGLLVVPAAPALKDIDCNAAYREALLDADLCIPDSAFMVMIWNRISKQKIHRLSGLKYLRGLLAERGCAPAGQCRLDHGRTFERATESRLAENTKHRRAAGVRVSGADVRQGD